MKNSPEIAAYTSQLLSNSRATIILYAFRWDQYEMWRGRMDIVSLEHHRGETTRLRYTTPEAAWYGAVSLIDGIERHLPDSKATRTTAELRTA